MFNNDYFECGTLASRQEVLSVAALHTVVASVGGTLTSSDHVGDEMGVDVSCKFKGILSARKDARGALALQVQLKSSRRLKPIIKNGEEFWALSINVTQLEKYLAWGSALILVLFILPSEEDSEHWVEINSEHIEVKKTLYWTSLVGFPLDKSQETNTVYISTKSILTPEALVNMLASLSEQKVLYYAGSY